MLWETFRLPTPRKRDRSDLSGKKNEALLPSKRGGSAPPPGRCSDMTASHSFPITADSDTGDVATALAAANALWTRGDPSEGLRCLRRAVDAAEAAGDDLRALWLAHTAAELQQELSAPATTLPPSSIPPSASRRPPPLPVAPQRGTQASNGEATPSSGSSAAPLPSPPVLAHPTPISSHSVRPPPPSARRQQHASGSSQPPAEPRSASPSGAGASRSLSTPPVVAHPRRATLGPLKKGWTLERVKREAPAAKGEIRGPGSERC